MKCGEQYVMTSGLQMMQVLPADNSGTRDTVCNTSYIYGSDLLYFQIQSPLVGCLEEEQDQFCWTMLGAPLLKTD